MSQTFKDSEGRAWTPRVSCATVLAMENATGIKLLDAACAALRDLGAKVEAGLTPLQMLELVNRVLDGRASNILRLAYFSVEKQAHERSVSFEVFCDALDGDCLAPALNAVGVATADFFLKGMAAKTTAATLPPSPGPGAPSTK